MAGIYAANGTIRVTIVDGSADVHLQAADGSINIIESDGDLAPLQHPCGAIRVTNEDNTKTYAPDGSWYKNHVYGLGITIVAGAFA